MDVAANASVIGDAESLADHGVAGYLASGGIFPPAIVHHLEITALTRRRLRLARDDHVSLIVRTATGKP